MFDPSFQRPQLPDARQTTDGAWIARVEMKDNLMPGSSADCYLVYFDGTNWTKNSNLVYKLYDPFYRVCAFKKLGGMSDGERLWAIWRPDMLGSGDSPDPNRLETLGEFGLHRRAKLTASLAKGGNATAHLYHDTTDTTIGITVYDWILSTGDSADNTTKCQVRWDVSTRRWDLISLQCKKD